MFIKTTLGRKINFKEMLKPVQHDCKRRIPHCCHPEPGPELASGSIDFGISVLVLNHLGFGAASCGRGSLLSSCASLFS